MTRRRNKGQEHIDWGVWIRSFGVWIIGFAGLLITFYFTTKDTLSNHEKQFVEIGKRFSEFNDTMKANYTDWAKRDQSNQDKADKVREQFLSTFNQLTVDSAATKVQVNTIGKQLETVTNKLDMIQDVQRQNRKRD